MAKRYVLSEARVVPPAIPGILPLRAHRVKPKGRQLMKLKGYFADRQSIPQLPATKRRNRTYYKPTTLERPHQVLLCDGPKAALAPCKLPFGATTRALDTIQSVVKRRTEKAVFPEKARRLRQHPPTLLVCASLHPPL